MQSAGRGQKNRRCHVRSGGMTKSRLYINQQKLQRTLLSRPKIPSMPQYFVLKVIPLLLSWPIWGSWLLSPCARCNPSTTTITTTIFTSTILPTATHTIITLENAHQCRERIHQEAEEHTEIFCRRHQEKKVRETASLLEEEIQAQEPWSAWLVDCCLQPIMYSLSACVAVHVIQNWHNIQVFYARL